MTLHALAEANLRARIGGNRYPGRGIVLGVNAPGTHDIQVYWVMGRSAGSRNRVMAMEGGRVKLKLHRPDPAIDPSLIVYTAMVTMRDVHIVTNGDQTDTIVEHMGSGGSFEDALLTRQHEPDAPHFTPRIAGLTETLPRVVVVQLAKIVRDAAEPSRSIHCVYTYHGFAPGTGMCLHTYMGDGNPLPSFEGDPYLVALQDQPEEIADAYWGLLDHDNRVALAVKAIERRTGKTSIVLRNRWPES